MTSSGQARSPADNPEELHAIIRDAINETDLDAFCMADRSRRPTERVVSRRRVPREKSADGANRHVHWTSAQKQTRCLIAT